MKTMKTLHYMITFIFTFVIGWGYTGLLELYSYSPQEYRMWVFPVFMGCLGIYYARKKVVQSGLNTLISMEIEKAAEKPIPTEEEVWLKKLDMKWEKGEFPVMEPKRLRRK
jgi:uncharacterized membrane protein YfcA